jgi:hypothetical protein
VLRFAGICADTPSPAVSQQRIEASLEVVHEFETVESVSKLTHLLR